MCEPALNDETCLSYKLCTEGRSDGATRPRSSDSCLVERRRMPHLTSANAKDPTGKNGNVGLDKFESCDVQQDSPDKDVIVDDSLLLYRDTTPLINDETDEENTSYDGAVDATGFGRFHVLLLLVCGWANASDAVETLSISFILPSARVEMELTGTQLGVLSGSIFFGMMIGGYVWGALSDIRGRRSVLLWSLSCNTFFGLMSSFAHHYWLFVLLRFMSGIGVGGATPVIFSYFGEFQPKKWRGSMISLLSTFWMLGNIIAATMAWVVIPRDIAITVGNFTMSSWRIFIVCCIIPAFTSVLTFLFMPESPKYLLESGRKKEALKVLQCIHHFNNGSKKTFMVTSLSPSASEDDIAKRREHQRNTVGCVEYYKDNLIVMFKSTSELFKEKYLRITILQLIIIFSLSFGYYGLYMWFPVLFEHVEQTGSACDNADFNSTHSSDVYVDTLYTAVANIPGNIVATILMDIVGRRFLVSSSLIVSGISVFFIWFVNTRTQVLIMSCIFGGIVTIAWNSFNVIQVELYPTHLRSTSIGAIALANRSGAIIGNLIFGTMIAIHCAVPIFIVAGVMVFGGLLTWALPNTTRKSLE